MTDLALIERLASADRDSRRRFLATLDRWEATRLLDLADRWAAASAQATYTPLREDLDLKDYQTPPDSPWLYWLLLGGRGAGKTQGVAAAMYDHVMNDPPCVPGVPGGHRVNVIGPTQGDAFETARVAYEPLHRGIRTVTRKGGTFIDFPDNGRGQATAKLLGAYTREDVQRLRAAGNTCRVHCEELAAWRQLGYENDAWDMMRTGLRLGPMPRVLVSTTPKPIPKIRELHDRAESGDDRYVMTRGSTYDADHLSPELRQEYIDLYEGTHLEAQELLGLLTDDVPGALWTTDLLADTRVSADAVPHLDVTVVGVDPNFSEEETADEAGIIVAGAGTPPAAAKRHGFVIADLSCRGALVWPTRAVAAYHEYEARAIVAESNLGGKDYLRRTIRAIDPTVNVEPVQATQGKRTRAEPFSLLYQKQRTHHVGTLALLEQQQTTWVPGDDSPNRLDALVWALAYLFPQLTSGRARIGRARGRTVPSGIPRAAGGRR